MELRYWLGRGPMVFGPIFEYSLISIRQNYNFDTSAMIWHEIVSLLLKIYPLLTVLAWEHRIVFVLIFRCAKQFYVPNDARINKQFHVKSWLTYWSYTSVLYLFSCKQTPKMAVRAHIFFKTKKRHLPRSYYIS